MMTKEQRKAYNKAHYASHRDRFKAEKLAYYHDEYKGRIDPAKRAAYYKKWRVDNPEKARGSAESRRRQQARKTQRYQNDPVFRQKILDRQRLSAPKRFMKNRTRSLRLKYGISAEHRDQLLAAQGGKCAICGATEGYQFPHVDHCHATGRVRGLLCQKCNHGIGLFKDAPDLLRAAASYLERHRKT